MIVPRNGIMNYNANHCLIRDVLITLFSILIFFIVILSVCIVDSSGITIGNISMRVHKTPPNIAFLNEEMYTGASLESVMDLRNPKIFQFPDEKEPYSFVQLPMYPEDRNTFGRTLFEQTPLSPVDDAGSIDEEAFPKTEFKFRPVETFEPGNMPQYNYPVFSCQGETLPNLPPLDLPSLRPLPDWYTAIRIFPKTDDGVLADAVVEAGCGIPSLDVLACRHLETYFDSDACPAELKRKSVVVYVVWTSRGAAN